MSTREQQHTTDSWQARLSAVVETVREMSLQTDPQAMVSAYARRMLQLFPASCRISLSRRGLSPPQFKVTRFSGWQQPVNPWKQGHLLPVLSGGILSELIWSDEPRIIDDLIVSPDDPAAEYLAGQRSLMAIPLLDQGVAINMVLLGREEPHAFDHERFPENVWLSNLFGRATHNLVLSDELRESYELADREMKAVQEIQRSLLPREMPRIPTLGLAAHYQTSRRAGGDYYDFFPLPDGRWGILIADASGHGTPAAVVMAITHSIAHLYPGKSASPSDLLSFVNRQLAARYTGDSGAFVTAFYGIYDPARKRLVYSLAGHNPPRMGACGRGIVMSLDGQPGLPLGIWSEEKYHDRELTLASGDRIVLYTDGITEAQREEDGEMWGIERLDQLLIERCYLTAEGVIHDILDEVEKFTAGAPATDDRTLIVATVE